MAAESRLDRMSYGDLNLGEEDLDYIGWTVVIFKRAAGTGHYIRSWC